MSHDTEGLVYCEECGWQGETSECDVNGDEEEGVMYTWLECITPDCDGTVIEL